MLGAAWRREETGIRMIGVTSRLEDVKKNDFRKSSELGTQKSLSRMLYKRPPEHRDTFRVRIEIAKNQPNQFFHIFLVTAFLIVHSDTMNSQNSGCNCCHLDLN
jgi:hypothetical protein